MPSTTIRQKIVRSAKRLVVKLGTHVLTDDAGRLESGKVVSLCGQVAGLVSSGREVIVVSSGAIGAGVGVLGLSGRPKDLATLQASAAVGQGKLMQVFERGLERFGLHAAQILVTRSDFEDRRRYLNIRHTIDALRRVESVPIINENDTVAVDEIRFGDNDLIAALTANLIQADLLVLLTVVDGLVRGKEVVDFVESLDDEIVGLADGGKSPLGIGGMRSKLQTIMMASQAGIDVVLANGRRRGILNRLILAGEREGTVFSARPRRLHGRRGWIALAARPAGRIVVDAGAARALIGGGKSLLPSGVVGVEGEFDRLDVVAVVDSGGRQLARGQVNYGSVELAKIKGRRSSEIARILGQKLADEVIHRNYMIVTAG